jgi:hypothetical protein
MGPNWLQQLCCKLLKSNPEPHPKRKKCVPSGNAWKFMKTQDISGGNMRDIYIYVYIYTYTYTYIYIFTFIFK